MTGLSKALGKWAKIMESGAGARSSRETGEGGLKQRVVALFH